MQELDGILSSKLESVPGLDGITYGMIKNFPEKLKEKFLQLINDTWMSQNIPAKLKEILLVLIPKPISLLSVYLKIMNSLVGLRLSSWIGRNGIFPDTLRLH